MRYRKLILIGLALTLALAVTGVAFAAAHYSARWNSGLGGGGGGGASSSASYTLHSAAAGGLLVGSSSASYSLCAGFLCAPAQDQFPMFVPFLHR